MSIKDKSEGIYGKYRVDRLDGGTEPGGKHENCKYFVLDLAHDPYAMPALVAYADACRQDFPALAMDLDVIVGRDDGPQDTVKK